MRLAGIEPTTPRFVVLSPPTTSTTGANQHPGPPAKWMSPGAPQDSGARQSGNPLQTVYEEVAPLHAERWQATRDSEVEGTQTRDRRRDSPSKVPMAYKNRSCGRKRMWPASTILTTGQVNCRQPRMSALIRTPCKCVATIWMLRFNGRTALQSEI